MTLRALYTVPFELQPPIYQAEGITGVRLVEIVENPREGRARYTFSGLVYGTPVVYSLALTQAMLYEIENANGKDCLKQWLMRAAARHYEFLADSYRLARTIEQADPIQAATILIGFQPHDIDQARWEGIDWRRRNANLQVDVVGGWQPTYDFRFNDLRGHVLDQAIARRRDETRWQAATRPPP